MRIDHVTIATDDLETTVNADSPTLPTQLLTEAITALRKPGDRVVLGPALDGGYGLEKVLDVMGLLKNGRHRAQVSHGSGR